MMKYEFAQASSEDQTRVSGGDLGTWIHPTHPPTLGQRPGDHWTVQKQVVNLEAPAIYRVRVSFRWLGSGQRILKTSVRLGRLCNQY